MSNAESTPNAESQPHDEDDALVSALVWRAAEPASPFQAALRALVAAVEQDPTLSSELQQVTRALGSGLLLQLLFAKLFPTQTGPVAKPVTGTDWERLTPQELKVVEQLAAGYEPKQAARRLGIGDSTLRIHQSNIRRKWNVTTPEETVAHAVALGLVRPEFEQRLAAARREYSVDYTLLSAVVARGADQVVAEAGAEPATRLASLGALLLLLTPQPAYTRACHWNWRPAHGPGVLLEAPPGGVLRPMNTEPGLREPQSLAVAPQAAAKQDFVPGHLYVSDRRGTIDPLNDFAIVELDPAGKYVRAFTGGRHLRSRLQFPVSLAFSADGSLLATSGLHTDAVLRFRRGEQQVERFAGLTPYGHAGLTTGRDGRVYATGGTPLGVAVHVFHADGTPAQVPMLGRCQLLGYQGIALDERGDRVYGAHNEAQLVKSYDQDGGARGTLNPGWEVAPRRLAVDARSRLYVLDELGQRLAIFDLQSQVRVGELMGPRGIRISDLVCLSNGRLLAVGWQE